MKNLYLVLFLFITITIFSQNILKGKISNKENVPLEGVNIYFDGTTISTISDSKGNFTIQYEPNANNILVISFMGYQTEYLTGLDVAKPLNIAMTVSQNELKEVVININELFTRAQKLKLFREYFLGKTNNAKGTIIQNESDLRFKFDKEKFVFSAYSDKPLTIINAALGYKIDFELVVFEVAFNKQSINSKDVIKNFYGGVSRFEDINNSAEVLERREKTYQGSQIQFFRNFAKKDWGIKKFILLNDDNSVDPLKRFKIIEEEDFVKVEILTQPKGEIKNENLNDIVASYNIAFNRTEESKITFQTDSFYIYKYGNNSNIESILFSGKISEKKVGDMLPLNYGIK
ncbi:carboxypeptidase-like regulatory domain-containing protein [Flavobacterium psychroterrae]|uniref:Carboxypeptidase-like regulatory domain-containing protein n=1 Tax=Flavobacterium psychroterrae TaxID=2133767 RepID=A0ABS5P8U2_9FLAO|nr:carboxypeptidase-like regulatory domain-containing protein [Flavobacterium psychroterrae]MBS7230717.1 carboxypeptidase-like regulatory domain-containing protein [Flavobacterium psychroterrae]